MKKTNFLNRFALTVLAMLMVGGIFASNNFYAWDFKNGHNGIAAGRLAFTSHSITVEFWINLNADGLVDGANIMETFLDPNGININIRKNSSNSNQLELRLFAKANNKDDNTAQGVYFYIPTSYYVENWAHVAFVISEDDEKGYAYINGDLFGEIAAPQGYYGNYKKSDNSSRALNLGSAFWSSPKFSGKLADIRIWSVARGAEEIKENYNKNLQGTYEDNPGLFINYRFYTYERGFINDANPDNTANKGWCNPEAGWNNYYGRETLAVSPKNMELDQENDILSWDAADGEWEVTIHKDSDNELVYTDTISTNSLALTSIKGLNGTTYYAKVRNVNNGFWSGQVQSDNFELLTSSVDKVESSLSFKVVNATLVVNVDQAQTLNIYSVSGQLIRSVNLVAGENQIQGLAQGLYIANNHKIVIR